RLRRWSRDPRSGGAHLDRGHPREEEAAPQMPGLRPELSPMNKRRNGMRLKFLRASASFAAGLFIALIMVHAPAAAESPAKPAENLFRKGLTEYNLGRFAEAISLFEKAYALDPTPELLLDIGQSHRQSGNYERALFFYRRYIETAPKSRKRPDVE